MARKKAQDPSDLPSGWVIYRSTQKGIPHLYSFKGMLYVAINPYTALRAAMKGLSVVCMGGCEYISAEEFLKVCPGKLDAINRLCDRLGLSRHGEQDVYVTAE